jgi:hypothetical protein
LAAIGVLTDNRSGQWVGRFGQAASVLQFSSGSSSGLGGGEDSERVGAVENGRDFANFCRGGGHWRRGAWVGDRRSSVAVHEAIMASVSEDGERGGEVTGWRRFGNRGVESRHT